MGSVSVSAFSTIGSLKSKYPARVTASVGCQNPVFPVQDFSNPSIWAIPTNDTELRQMLTVNRMPLPSCSEPKKTRIPYDQVDPNSSLQHVVLDNYGQLRYFASPAEVEDYIQAEINANQTALNPENIVLVKMNDHTDVNQQVFLGSLLAHLPLDLLLSESFTSCPMESLRSPQWVADGLIYLMRHATEGSADYQQLAMADARQRAKFNQHYSGYKDPYLCLAPTVINQIPDHRIDAQMIEYMGMYTWQSLTEIDPQYPQTMNVRIKALKSAAERNILFEGIFPPASMLLDMSYYADENMSPLGDLSMGAYRTLLLDDVYLGLNINQQLKKSPGPKTMLVDVGAMHRNALGYIDPRYTKIIVIDQMDNITASNPKLKRLAPP